MPSKYELTPVEYELMLILWKLGKGTVRDVIAQLPKNRDLAYTSVSTMLRILQQKKILRAIKSGRTHSYQPLIAKDAYANYSLKKMVNHIFAGQSAALVAQLVERENLTLADIETLQQLLAQKKKELIR